MNWLIFGIALFTAVHLVSAVVPASCRSLKAAIGDKVFRSVYSLLVLAGLVLIVVGWRSAVPVAVYAPPAWGPTVAFLLMFAAVFLFGASHAKTNFKRYLRHPQLTGVLLFSAAHLLANGDSRSKNCCGYHRAGGSRPSAPGEPWAPAGVLTPISPGDEPEGEAGSSKGPPRLLAGFLGAFERVRHAA